MASMGSDSETFKVLDFTTQTRERVQEREGTREESKGKEEGLIQGKQGRLEHTVENRTGAAAGVCGHKRA